MSTPNGNRLTQRMNRYARARPVFKIKKLPLFSGQSSPVHFTAQSSTHVLNNTIVCSSAASLNVEWQQQRMFANRWVNPRVKHMTSFTVYKILDASFVWHFTWTKFTFSLCFLPQGRRLQFITWSTFDMQKTASFAWQIAWHLQNRHIADGWNCPRHKHGISWMRISI